MPAIPSPAKKQPKPSLTNLRAARVARGENQQQFWSRFGVTQSGGSRYEGGRNISEPTGILVMLYLTGGIDDAALIKIRKAIKASTKK